MPGTWVPGIAVVTGAASGIGAACCRELARRGARIALLDRDERVYDVSREVNGYAWIVDVADEGALNRCADSIETKLDLDSSPVTGMLDEPSIRATTLNLVLNAVQAMPAGGHLTISTSSSEGKLLMLISDTGSGMTPDQIKQIFEPFNTTKSRGLGLGMPYAQKIIQQHGGQIVVESQPGKGTDVRIELPANERN